jgi:DNA-binding CsgD family transcriptional regulator
VIIRIVEGAAMRAMPLSPREKKLLRRFGRSDKLIAAQIGGTPKQVADQRARLLARFKMSEAELSAVAEKLSRSPSTLQRSKAPEFNLGH